MTMCCRHVAVPCAACAGAARTALRSRRRQLMPKLQGNGKAAPLERSGQGNAICRQAARNCFLDQRKMQDMFRQILKIACHMITEKSAEHTRLVSARSKNAVSPSRDLILIFTVTR